MISDLFIFFLNLNNGFVLKKNALFDLTKGDIFDEKNLLMWRRLIDALLHFDELTYMIELEAPKSMLKMLLLRNVRHMNNENIYNNKLARQVVQSLGEYKIDLQLSNSEILGILLIHYISSDAGF